MRTDDLEIFQRIKCGDYHSFSILFHKYYERLCVYVFEVTGNYHAAKDITQDVFIKLWNGRESLEITGKVNAYLFRACRNSALNYLRQEANQQKLLQKMEAINRVENNDWLEEQEFTAFVEGCIDKLPERSKEVFKLSRFEGLKQKEISQKLGISVKTIKDQIWKSLQYLRTCLQEKDIDI